MNVSNVITATPQYTHGGRSREKNIELRGLVYILVCIQDNVQDGKY